MDQERYELLDVIGSGGMATVWRARDNRLGRIVAIKRPHPAPADSTVFPRFAREARAAAAISHRHLVNVYDVGEDQIGPYLVMEYVNGPSLALANVPRDRITTLGIQVAAALAALHDAGVVHGDVKPGNILIAGDDAKLTDFGIARTVDDPTLTREGVALGTAAYSAPETLATGVRSAAADIYSLGAVLHEQLTGTRWSATAGTTQPTPSPAWRTVLAPALSNDPQRRPTARAFEQSLRRLADGDLPTTPVTMAPASVTDDHRQSTRTASMILLAFLAAAVAAGGVVALANGGGDDRVTASTPPAVDTSLAPPVEPTVSEAPAPTSAPATTVAPTTTAEVVPDPTVRPPSTTPAELAAAVEVAGRVVDLVEAAVPDQLKAPAGDQIVREVAAALRAANDGDDERAARSLRTAFDRAERDASDEAREELLQELVELTAALGLDPADVLGRGRQSDEWYTWITELFGGGRGDGDDDDEEGRP